jgi:hypothetical protein
MNLPAYLRSIAARFLHRSEVAEDMEEELRSHIQYRADDLERSGLDRVQAERQARIEFGARERFKEECHQAMGGHFFETLVQDVRFAPLATPEGASVGNALGNHVRDQSLLAVIP